MSHRALLFRVFVFLLSLGAAGRPASAAWPHDPNVNVPIAPFSAYQGVSSAVSDGAGGAIIVWVDQRSGNYDVYAQRLTASGTVAPGWPAGGLAVCTATGNQYGPQAVSDGAGGAIIAWFDQRLGASNGDIFAMRVAANGTFPAGWPANGRQLLAESHDEANLSIASDGAGGAVVAWELVWILGSDVDVYGARVNGSGVVQWAHFLYAPSGFQAHVSVVPDDASGLIVAFEDNSAGPYNVTAVRFNAAGTNLWIRTVSAAANDQTNPIATTDGAGGVIVGFRDTRNGNPDIYAQRLTAAGSVPAGWAADGNPVCRAANAQLFPLIVADGAGGAILSWYDLRGGVDYDVYAQRILPGGATGFGWPVDGAGVCTASGIQYPTSMIPDGSGGAILCWPDTRNGLPSSEDVFASRITSAGSVAPGWVYDGTPISLGGSQQFFPVLATDGAGGAIAAWSDYRVGANPNAFAQNVDRFGTLGDARPAITSIKDVKADQGGFVRLAWNASYLDADPGYEIASYWIWRQTPASVASAAVATGGAWLEDSGDRAAFAAHASDGGGKPRRWFRHAESAAANYAWEFVVSQPSNGSLQYSYVAPTASDSIAGYNPSTVYMVEARGTATGAFWDSAPDSGYSVDNLPPSAPAPFSVSYSAGSSSLSWGPSLEPDFGLYRIYRGAITSFVPGPETFVAEVTDPGYVDSPGRALYYRVCAFDVHGNPSCTTAQAGAPVVDVGDTPTAGDLSLSPVVPNPADEVVQFQFTLPRGARASLVIYDVAGRMQRTLFSGTLPAGRHVGRWDLRDGSGSPVRAGLYFVRLEAENRHLNQRILVSR